MDKKYHFIAIGGIGMSGLAKFLLEKGIEVSGSDVCDSKYIHKIQDLGAKVFIGHDEKNLPEDCTVVASTAIRENNPELQKARRLGLRILHRSDLLAEIGNVGHYFIGFSGTHGKTTTSGLATYVLEKGGLAPSFVVGGIIPEINTNAKFAGKYFVAELDESDGTIVKYCPQITVINNLESDHMDFYKNGLDSMVETFSTFVNGLDKTAKVIINNDCEGNILLAKAINKDFITFGLNEADYVAKNIEYSHAGSTFEIFYKEKKLIDIKLSILGKHNVYNALAVVAALNEAGIELEKIREHFATFSGMGRRFEFVGKVGEIPVYDDYAHHPSEIKATMDAMKHFSDKKIVAVFQPHRYTRLKALWNDFLKAFEDVDRIIVTDIFEASEDPIQGITSANFVKELKGGEYLSGSMREVAAKLLPTLKTDDVVIGLGAGTITELGKELLKLGN